MMSNNFYYLISPSSSLMENIVIFHDFIFMILMGILSMIFFFMIVMTLVWSDFNLLYLDDHQLEVLWTVSPMIILMFIIIPSTCLLYFTDSCFFCGFTIFILGHQWYWSYFIKDLYKNSFDSYMISDNNVLRLLEVDNRLLVPFNFPIRFLCSSSDVIHSWTVPSLGIKMDAVPGRINQYCTSFKRSGLFFGQCSEICGINHSFMPIVIESLDLDDLLMLQF